MKSAVSFSLLLACLLLACLLFRAAGALGQQPAETLDLSPLLGEDEPAIAPEGEEEAEPGDNKTFRITTDNDITSLEVGDLYKNNKSVFKVTAIQSKGSLGGKFTVTRIGGRAAPSRTWIRSSGLGPTVIESRETLWDLYLAGGSLMHPIAACMAITIIIGLNSVWVFRRGRQCPPAFIEPARQTLKRGSVAEFQELALKERGLFGHICRAMAVRFDTSTLEDIKDRCELEAGRQIRRMRAPLQGLSLMAAVAPLLGLLGTVIGMVMSFEAVAYESASASKAQMLASGIRVALFTTVGGLIVAIPALFILFLSNLALGAVVSECETHTEQFVHEIAQLKRAGDNGSPAPAPAPATPIEEAAR